MVNKAVAVNEVVQNISDAVNFSQVFEQISPALLEKLAPLITILKAVGIVFVIYLVYSIVAGFFKWRDRKRLKRIEEKVDAVLDRVGGLDEKQEKNKKHKKGVAKKKAKKSKNK